MIIIICMSILLLESWTLGTVMNSWESQLVVSDRLCCISSKTLTLNIYRHSQYAQETSLCIFVHPFHSVRMNTSFK